MKGVVLGGGMGTRLLPLTETTNKHLLLVHDRPMICYPLECLRTAGIDEALIVTGGNHADGFARLLGDGAHFGFRRLSYAHQREPGGIAQALSLAEEFAGGESVCVILGDNLIGGSIRGPADRFRAQGTGARVLIQQVGDPTRFGIARFADATRSRIAEIVEKPGVPPSDFAVLGIYFYDRNVFDICRTLRPSARGELEITDVNNAYIARGALAHEVLPGWWIDAGTAESLQEASRLVARLGANREHPSRPE